MTRFKKILLCTITLLPIVTLAQYAGDTDKGLGKVLATIDSLLVNVVPIVIALGLIVFLWGLVEYLWSSSDEQKKSAVSIIIWGIVILFVMVGVWGLVAVLGETFDISTKGSDTVVSPPLPGFGY